MDGFEVMKMADAALVGDLFITLTGCRDVITMEHILTMREGAVMCNAGHFDVEISVAEMRKCAMEVYEARHNIDAFKFENGKTVYLLAEGRLVNLAAGDGHPAEIMDTSFALQVMSAEYLAKNAGKLQKGVYEVPPEIDTAVAEMKLRSMGIDIDKLTDEPYRYIHSSNG